jgi:hypothetical protein
MKDEEMSLDDLNDEVFEYYIVGPDEPYPFKASLTSFSQSGIEIEVRIYGSSIKLDVSFYGWITHIARRILEHDSERKRPDHC